MLTGGIRTPSDALAGPVAEAAISTLNVDMLFLGVHGMSPRTGFTTPNLMEAGTDRLLVAAARRLVVLADHTKWETVGIATIAPLEDADVLITDAGLPAEARSQLADGSASSSWSTSRGRSDAGAGSGSHGSCGRIGPCGRECLDHSVGSGALRRRARIPVT